MPKKPDAPGVTRTKIAAKKPRRKSAISGTTEIKPTGLVRDTRSKFFSAGSYTSIDEHGNIHEGVSMAARSRVAKTAGLFMSDDSAGGSFADIADSSNIGYYNFEFPVDSLEQPQQRRQELKYFRIAYDRDPIVSRAINLHTELPLSKLVLDKPKCSSEEFADYVYDFYWQLVQDTKLFEQLYHATREYWLVGEAFLFVEDPDEAQPCPVAMDLLGKKSRRGGTPVSESYNPPHGLDSLSLMENLSPSKRSSFQEFRRVASALGEDPTKAFEDDTDILGAKILAKKASLKKKTARFESMLKTADDDILEKPEDTKAEAEDAPLGTDGVPMVSPLREYMDAKEDAGVGDEGEDTPPGIGGGDDDLDMDMAEDIDFGPTPEEQARMDAEAQVVELRKLVKLLERKRELLLELKTLREQRERDYELFSHIVNPEYYGYTNIKLIPPETVEIKRDPRFNDGGPTIMYRPSPEQKNRYLDDPDLDPDCKDILEQEGIIPLNTDPLKGSFCIHFARKRAPFEDHGRSILQPVLRTVMYRDKLRQVQVTLASRNMTPKTVIIAPGISPQEAAVLRSHADEAKADPDYTLVLTYEATWNEIGTEGRLLMLDGEWQHTNSDLATGLGFTPELLIGEGFFSGNRIHLELMNSTYLLYRDMMAEMVEATIFKPLAMKKGFFEIDKYNRPRWLYPKLSFSRLALRDSGDVYEMLYNLYSKGSLPVSVIYEFLNLDPESCRRELEANLFTVMDSKFNQLLDGIYSAVYEKLVERTDLVDRVSQGCGLTLREQEDAGLEGSGEGM